MKAGITLAGPPAWARVLLVLSVVMGLGVIWASPRPPMIDLPQHAAQIALLRDLILHRSAWAGEFKLNFFTPYLIGYGLALPLTFLMPVTAAVKVVLSVAFVAFTGAGMALGRALKAAPELDAYYPLAFFAYPFGWGFFTFLTAAPLALLFVLGALRYARAPSGRRGAVLVLFGAALLFCHALAFLMAVGIGGLLLIGSAGIGRRLAGRLWPYAIVGVLLAAFAAVQISMHSQEDSVNRIPLAMGPLWRRVSALLGAPFFVEVTGVTLAQFAAFAAAPFALGLRIDWRARDNLIVSGAILAILALAPDDAWGTNLIYTRFALFLLPAYAWLFTRRVDPSRPRLATLARVAMPLTLGATLLTMGDRLARTVHFAAEARDFETILARMEPGQRALSMVFDSRSEATGVLQAYVHHPLWYQADKHGLVEYNFAWFHPEPVRYRHVDEATIKPGLSWDPGGFDWRRQRGDRYRYFVIRAEHPLPAGLFAGAPCAPVPRGRAGPWLLLEAEPCS